jgi:ribosomal protein L23
MLIEVAIPADRNVIKREVENIFEYKDLIIEIQRMWNVTAKVIIGTTGTNPKSLRQYLSNTAGRHEIKELTKNSRIGHCTHTMESANVKVQNIFHGRNKITFRKTVNTKQLQHSIL